MSVEAPLPPRSSPYRRAQRIMLFGSVAVLAIAAPLLVAAKLNGTLPAHITWTQLAFVLPCVLAMNAIFWLPRSPDR